LPLIFHRNLRSTGELGLWKIEEEEDFFMDKLTLLPLELDLINATKGHRKLEWLASRWLLHQMSGRDIRGACLKNEFGKPYLENSFFEISISHSRELVSVIAAPQAVGIDIQKLVNKIESISHKFLREEEKASLSKKNYLEHLHVYWGAKEALFKAYGRKQLDFKQHIFIKPFAFNLRVGKCYGYVQKEDYYADFELRYEQIDDYILVYAIEIVEDERIA
jgi:4'-phosphopantetheinyl transferase